MGGNNAHTLTLWINFFTSKSNLRDPKKQTNNERDKIISYSYINKLVAAVLVDFFSLQASLFLSHLTKFTISHGPTLACSVSIPNFYYSPISQTNQLDNITPFLPSHDVPSLLTILLTFLSDLRDLSLFPHFSPPSSSSWTCRRNNKKWYLFCFFCNF